MLPVKHFTDYIEQNQLFERGNNILAAVSGGMDSVLMALLLHAAGYKFGIAHCNFKLRGDEAEADQQFCCKLALKLNVPFHTVEFNTADYAAQQKISIQMAARDLRYEWFEQIRHQHGFDFIALAHHQNDTIETILLNMVRGTGIAGMHGIMPKNGFLVRPMLGFTRQDVLQTIQENQISYVEDSSNASVKYARNKIRLEVIPKLKELNPALEQTFQQHLRHFRELEQLMDAKIAAVKSSLLEQRGNDIYISLEKVRQLNPQHLLLSGLLKPFGFSETMVDDIISVLDKHAGRLFETATHRLVLDRSWLILSAQETNHHEHVIIQEDTRQVRYNNYHIAISHSDAVTVVKNNPFVASVDADLLIYPLHVRCWQQSDYFYPLGMKTRKKLSDFFINQKVPLHHKSRIPIVVNGNGDIIWVGGYRPDERYKVKDQTKKITIFDIRDYNEQ